MVDSKYLIDTINLLFLGVQYHNCTNGEVRLSDEISGRLEICFGNVWFGSFCNYLNFQDRNVICGMLNYSTQGIKSYFTLDFDNNYSRRFQYIYKFIPGTPYYTNAAF